MDRNIDIFDSDRFLVKNVHGPETNPNNQTLFRWTDGYFEVTPKLPTDNMCLNVICTDVDKKVIVFIENETKNFKFEFQIRSGVEYILFIPLTKNETVSFYITPNVSTTNGDTRILGLYLKKIYTSPIKNDKLTLLNMADGEFVKYLNTDFFTLGRDDIFDEIPCTEQHSDVSILNLKYTKKNFHYNASLFTHNNKNYVMTRHSTIVTKTVQVNTLQLYEYDTMKNLELCINDEFEFEQYEDPRVLSHDGKLYVSCANYIHDKPHIVHQKILIFDDTFKHVGNIHPKYGYNRGSFIENIGKEKNWTFFIHENKLMCVYKIHPHTVVEFDWNGRVVSEYITHNIDINWKYGDLRGGANPVYKDGYYHSFFHSSLPWKHEHRRRYMMGYYKFEPNPPFKIVEMSEKPILWGNEKDERILEDISPLVIFPCGVIIEDNKFVVSFGLNDEKTGIIKI